MVPAAMLDFTTVVAVDAEHVAEWERTWPTWRRHRPEILARPLLVICDGAITNWRRRLAFLDHPDYRTVTWNGPGATQREKMLASLVFIPARELTTPWYLKLDTDAVAIGSGPPEPSWFAPDEDGRVPAFVASPWSYTKPAGALDVLERWADGVEALRRFPRLNLTAAPGALLVRHPRIISWCFYGHTAWTREVAGYCADDRLPIPSQDTYLWYCAERMRWPYRRILLKRHGWRHLSNPRRLAKVCREVVDSKSPGLNPTVPNPRSSHADVLIDLLVAQSCLTGCGAEVGVALGATSEALLRRCPNLRLTMVDSWQAYDSEHPYFRSGDGCARLTEAEQQRRADLARRRTEFASERRVILRADSTAGAEHVADETLDFVFLDADHTYAAVRRDLRAWWPKLRRGGLFCGHDYDTRKERRGLWGVARAVDEFVAKAGLQLRRHPASVWSVLKPGVRPMLDSFVRSASAGGSSARSSAVGKRSFGFVYLLTGPSHAVRAVVSIRSLRRWFNGPITLFTTHPSSHEVGRLCAADPRLRVEHRTWPLTKTRKNASFLTKVALLPHVPYETGAYLDADTLVVGEVAELRTALDDVSFAATQFADWMSTSRNIRRRIAPWSRLRASPTDTALIADLVRQAEVPVPAVNGGVFGFRRDAALLKPWYDLALLGRRTFICDEIALQLLLPRYPHRVLDCRYNCSPTYAGSTADVRIWHFHGEKHLRPGRARELWLPALEECLHDDTAHLRRWGRNLDDEAFAASSRR